MPGAQSCASSTKGCGACGPRRRSGQARPVRGSCGCSSAADGSAGHDPRGVVRGRGTRGRPTQGGRHRSGDGLGRYGQIARHRRSRRRGAGSASQRFAVLMWIDARIRSAWIGDTLSPFWRSRPAEGPLAMREPSAASLGAFRSARGLRASLRTVLGPVSDFRAFEPSGAPTRPRAAPGFGRSRGSPEGTGPVQRSRSGFVRSTRRRPPRAGSPQPGGGVARRASPTRPPPAPAPARSPAPGPRRARSR